MALPLLKFTAKSGKCLHLPPHSNVALITWRLLHFFEGPALLVPQFCLTIVRSALEMDGQCMEMSRLLSDDRPLQFGLYSQMNVSVFQ